MCTNVHSFEYLLESFILDRRPAKSTIKHYKLVIRLFQKDTGITDIRELNRVNILKWRNTVSDRASPATCNNYLRHMKSLFNCAVDNEIIEKSPFERIRGITSHKRSNRTTTIEKISEAIEFLKGESQYERPGWFWILVIRMFYFTGMRRRQLAELRWKDIDFDEHFINLRIEGSKTKREWDVPFKEDIITDLIRLKKEMWDVFGVNTNLDDMQIFNVTLFNSRFQGEQMTADQISRFFRSLSKSLGFKLSPHRFRHKYATTLANKEKNMKHVQILLGHTNIMTTYGYVQPDMQSMKELVSQLPSV